MIKDRKSNNRGWIKLYRTICDHWISDDKPYGRFGAWIYLYLNANHKDNEILVNGKLLKVERGQRLTSIDKLAEKWGWSRHKVSDFLNLLEEDDKIRQKRTSKYTLITILEYNVEQNRVVRKDIIRKSSGHRKDTNNNDKNDSKKYRNPLVEA